MIELDRVRFEYPSVGGSVSSFALEIPSLLVKKGEHAACIGPSGCGKTTLVNLIAGIVRARSGSVRVGGVEVSSLAEGDRRRFRQREIGMVFQEFELLEHLTALDNIRLPMLVGDDARAFRRAAPDAERLAAAVGIAHVLRRKPRRLSQGERQRVGICRAMITNPKLLLCDEPTGNLDPESTASALDVLLAQARERNATLVMVTHNHDVLRRFGRVIDMRRLREGGSE